MSFLPLDYYLLLEEGYEEDKKEVARTPFIYFKNLPLLYRKRSVLNSYKIYRGVFGDVLQPSFYSSGYLSMQPSVEIMKFSLERFFGKVRSTRLLNFSPEALKKHVEKLRSSSNLEDVEDQITEFERLYTSLFEKELGAGEIQNIVDESEISSANRSPE